MIQCPFNSGSLFYKLYFSIVYPAVPSADYRFVMVDVGAYGSSNDSGVLNYSIFFKHLRKKNLDVPTSKQLPNDTEETHLPYVLLQDEAFPLRFALMRLFSRNTLTNERCIFNYRLSRARRVVENAFGILANCWRIYHCHICLNPNNVTTVVKATIVLHNILTLPNDKVGTDIVDNRATYLMMPLRTSQRKEIDLQQLPMMSETTLLTTSIVIVVLMNGTMIAHEIEFKITDYIKLFKTHESAMCLIDWPTG